MNQPDPLVIEYDRSKVIARLIPFQLIGIIILLISALLLAGVYSTEYKVALPLVMATGFAMYLYFNWIIWGFLKHPLFLKISLETSKSGAILQYRDKNFKISSGAIIAYNDRLVSIRPVVMGIPHAIQRDGATIIRLPSGLGRIGDGKIKVS